MVNFTRLACNPDRSEETLKKNRDLLAWVILQDQNLYGSGGC